MAEKGNLTRSALNDLSWEELLFALDHASVSQLPALLKHLMDLNLSKSLRPGGVLKLATIAESEYSNRKG